MISLSYLFEFANVSASGMVSGPTTPSNGYANNMNVSIANRSIAQKRLIQKRTMPKIPFTGHGFAGTKKYTNFTKKYAGS